MTVLHKLIQSDGDRVYLLLLGGQRSIKRLIDVSHLCQRRRRQRFMFKWSTDGSIFVLVGSTVYDTDPKKHYIIELESSIKGDVKLDELFRKRKILISCRSMNQECLNLRCYTYVRTYGHTYFHCKCFVFSILSSEETNGFFRVTYK